MKLQADEKLLQEMPNMSWFRIQLSPHNVYLPLHQREGRTQVFFMPIYNTVPPLVPFEEQNFLSIYQAVPEIIK